MSMMNKHLCAFIEFEQAFDIVIDIGEMVFGVN